MKKKNYQSELKIPSNVEIEKKKEIICFKGPLGQNIINIKKLDQKGSIAIKYNQLDNIITVISNKKAIHRSLISLIKNKMIGISQGYLLYLRIVGIGYKCSLNENTLSFRVGFSHQVNYKIPKSTQIFLQQPTLLCLFGIDINQITQIAAQIRNIKPPSPYKGKGIRFLDEEIRIKQGKQK